MGAYADSSGSGATAPAGNMPAAPRLSFSSGLADKAHRGWDLAAGDKPREEWWPGGRPRHRMCLGKSRVTTQGPCDLRVPTMAWAEAQRGFPLRGCFSDRVLGRTSGRTKCRGCNPEVTIGTRAGLRMTGQDSRAGNEKGLMSTVPACDRAEGPQGKDGGSVVREAPDESDGGLKMPWVCEKRRPPMGLDCGLSGFSAWASFGSRDKVRETGSYK